MSSVIMEFDDEDPGPLTLRQAWEMARYFLRSVLGGDRGS